jgi:hypothetical protein
MSTPSYNPDFDLLATAANFIKKDFNVDYDLIFAQPQCNSIR